MMDWTDKHCRHFFRLLSPNALIYTEMIPTDALIYGKNSGLLSNDTVKNPVSLQLGGNDPTALARCAEMGEKMGYSEINLNCGCPSERVKKGAFGVILMKNPHLVKKCLLAIIGAVSIPVTVKHRLGIDNHASYEFVREFVNVVHDSGCTTFIVHARNAILGKLSPRDNRRIPPLKYDYVYRLQKDFPDLIFILNGGLDSFELISKEMQQNRGVMIGRAAYNNPYILSEIEHKWFGEPLKSRYTVASQMEDYANVQVTKGVRMSSITKCMLGLFKSQPNAKQWRQILSDHSKLSKLGPAAISYALSKLEQVNNSS